MSDAVSAPHGFTVICQRSGRQVEVAPDQSILDALLEAGLLPDHSCKKGQCGSCETRVLACDGKLLHRDEVLTESEHAAGNSMTICVSRCTGARLVLDI